LSGDFYILSFEVITVNSFSAIFLSFLFHNHLVAPNFIEAHEKAEQLTFKKHQYLDHNEPDFHYIVRYETHLNQTDLTGNPKTSASCQQHQPDAEQEYQSL
jgi:hypothetical protein